MHEELKEIAIENFLVLRKCYQNHLRIPNLVADYFIYEINLLDNTKKQLKSEIEIWLQRMDYNLNKISLNGLIKRLVDLQTKILIETNCLTYHETTLLLFHCQNGTILN